MSNFINAYNVGSFNDNITFVPIITANNMFFTEGREILPVSNNTSVIPLTSNVSRINGIYLNIHKIKPNLTGKFSITINRDNNNTTFVYDISSLYQSLDNISLRTNKSEYWQGFSFPVNIDVFTITLSCSTPGDVEIVTGIKNNFNRIFVPDPQEGEDPNTSFIHPTAHPGANFYIGSVILDGESMNLYVPPTFLYNTNTLTASTINVFANTTLQIDNSVDPVIPLNCQVILYPGSKLFIPQNTKLTLNENCQIIGTNNSSIFIEGTYKTPYTFLKFDILENTQPLIIFAVDDINTWKLNDTALFTGGTAVNSLDTRIIQQVFTNDFTLNAHPFTHTNYAFSSVSAFDGTLLYLSPICNLTRNTVISSISSVNSYIYAEENCDVLIRNTSFINIGTVRGAVNLLNEKTTIENCVFHSCFAGIELDISYAKDVNIYNNIFTSNNRGLISNKSTNVTFKTSDIRQNNTKIYNNIFVNNNIGAQLHSTTTASISSNIFTENNSNGILININNSKNYIKYFSNNLCIKNKGTGASIYSTSGKIQKSFCMYNTSHGCYINNSEICLSGLDLSNNGGYGLTINNNHLSISGYDLNINLNTYGLRINTANGILSSVNITNNTLSGAEVIDCYKNILSLYSLYIYNNGSSLIYRYPSNYYSNTFPTYLTNSRIINNLDNTCITLDTTNCEKFVVENTVLSSADINVKFLVKDFKLIEGSYVFSNCTFNKELSNIDETYQTDTLNESAVASMYINNSPTYHKKIVRGGVIESDTTVYFNPVNKISEKITPTSADIPVKSSKKIVYINGSLTESRHLLNVSVKVKKTNWGSNSNPILVVKSSPILNISNDIILSTHNFNSEEWIVMSGSTVIVSDHNIAIELYIESKGNSGGSINVDQWDSSITPAPSITPTAPERGTITNTSLNANFISNNSLAANYTLYTTKFLKIYSLIENNAFTNSQLDIIKDALDYWSFVLRDTALPVQAQPDILLGKNFSYITNPIKNIVNNNGYILTVNVLNSSSFSGILGAASYVYTRSSESDKNTKHYQLPSIGSFSINSEYISSMTQLTPLNRTQLYYTVLHEVGHALGIGSAWHILSESKLLRSFVVGAGDSSLNPDNNTAGNIFYTLDRGDNSRTDNDTSSSAVEPMFSRGDSTFSFAYNPDTVIGNSSAAVTAYNACFSTSLTAIPLENISTSPGSYGCHWSEGDTHDQRQYYGNTVPGAPGMQDELMTPSAEGSIIDMPVSKITLGSLQDIGWVVDINYADNYEPYTHRMRYFNEDNTILEFKKYNFGGYVKNNQTVISHLRKGTTYTFYNETGDTVFFIIQTPFTILHQSSENVITWTVPANLNAPKVFIVTASSATNNYGWLIL